MLADRLTEGLELEQSGVRSVVLSRQRKGKSLEKMRLVWREREGECLSSLSNYKIFKRNSKNY